MTATLDVAPEDLLLPGGPEDLAGVALSHRAAEVPDRGAAVREEGDCDRGWHGADEEHVESAEHVPKRRPTMLEHQKDDTQQRRETDLDRDKAEDVPPASTQESPELHGGLLSRE